MTRNLPWQKSSTTINRGKRSSTVTSSTPKRLKTNSVRGQSESEGTASPVKGLKRNEKENDDKYRMVEDEFLTVAQKFTVHLHAAEYKRQQTQVKARNADAIRSISRPVSTKMPEQTKRKVEAHERSLAQKNLVEGLRKQAKEDEESDSRISSINAPSTSKTAPSRLSRLDYARMQKVKQEVKIEEEKELDVIPSFL
ncbi:hypothetical protein M7I_4471 [Glarea lozoyensis 74030]|uniref:Uncharacterized protein n=1 Tax=Glarea lozoyensis (strain ATCC 74030 / MF5533) TaxID=1104152 RepID=H0EPA0_GLAL7|nr:hypothetical protein M7I_4471 [Glarea lozoyensis 74030]